MALDARTDNPSSVPTEPHHDGSELYVHPITPHRGEYVTVRVRVPLSYHETAVHLRSVRDGEPRLTPAHIVAENPYERWYEARLLVHNPVTSYRFFFAFDNDYAWLNGTGLHYQDVPDSHDFKITVHQPAPAWLHDGIVYQIFPDRFARSTHAPALTETQLPHWAIPAAHWDEDPIPEGLGVAHHYFGGDLDGITEHVDYLKDLGVTTVYLTPIFPGESNHRYDASTFDCVDPLLGGNEAYTRLIEQIHSRGMKIIGDITTNHTGVSHSWFTTAATDPASEEHSYYYWTDDETGYACWLEHPSLPKLNYNSHALTARMIDGPQSIIGTWMQPPFSIDGWRVDVANMTGRYGNDNMTTDIARRIRTTMTDINAQSLLISEHFHDASTDLDGDGWHGNMNYSAFTRPVWSFIAHHDQNTPAFGLPAPLIRRSGTTMVQVMREFAAQVPFTVSRDHWNMLGSHDTPRLRTLIGTDDMTEVAAGLLFTYLGNPVVFAGDEVGLTGINGEHARKTMPWNDPTRWHQPTHDTYRALIRVRSESKALQVGGLRWIVTDDDAVAYVRETPDECVLVLIARSRWNGARVSVGISAGLNYDTTPVPQTLYGAHDIHIDGDEYVLPQVGSSVHIWRLNYRHDGNLR
ncbi:glycoside hydrolase family 13 protein [Timonella sp. A28]|uniref:glycoside hydrolase family 13 protein n=1 Tax=Timonella sp. A28 TaxID=3442640 RepID=UPI003EBCE6AF